ncbi:hypothetical protein LTR66_000256 [Elasticomyces elasticus]|nr:hypothetical protein LTR66_000256 [Elasticomyces elasticus]
MDAAAAARSAPRPRRVETLHMNISAVFQSLAALTHALSDQLKPNTGGEIPQLTQCAFSLDAHARLPVVRPHEHHWSAMEGPESQQLALSVYEVVLIPEGKGRQTTQRNIARGIINAIMRVDGFKYAFNNNWHSKDDGGYRFSYTCLDSLQNKDRHANAYQRTTKKISGLGVPGIRKPTYDCKGSIAVKFSGVRQCIDVVYRHNAIHATAADGTSPLAKRQRNTLNTDSIYEQSSSLLTEHSPMSPYPDTMARLHHSDKEEREPSLVDLLRESMAQNPPPPTMAVGLPQTAAYHVALPSTMPHTPTVGRSGLAGSQPFGWPTESPWLEPPSTTHLSPAQSRHKRTREGCHTCRSRKVKVNRVQTLYA